MPQVLDRLHLGEEPVASDVETPPIPFDGAADAAHHVVDLDHHHRVTAPDELVSRGKAGWTGSDDNDGIGEEGTVSVKGAVPVRGILPGARSVGLRMGRFHHGGTIGTSDREP